MRNVAFIVSTVCVLSLKLFTDANGKKFNSDYNSLCKPGVSDSNPLKGHISWICSAGRRLKENWLCGPHFLEEGYQGYRPCLHLKSLKATFLPKKYKNPKFSIEMLKFFNF